MSYFTQQQRHAWSDDEACGRLVIAVGLAKVRLKSDGSPVPWYAAFDPEWWIDPFKEGWVWDLWLWMGQPAPPGWRVFCDDAKQLAKAYAIVGIPMALTGRAGVDAMNDWIDSTGWQPAGE